MNWKFRIFVFIACVFATRIHLKRNSDVSANASMLTKIGTALNLVVICSPLITSSVFCVSIFLFLQHLFFSHLSQLFCLMNLRNVEQKRLSATQRLLQSMQLGDSFRSAIDKLVASERDTFWLQQWVRIRQSVVFSQQAKDLPHRFLVTFSEDLIACDRSNFQQIVWLQQIREHYLREFNFRRRSGQILLQLRAQALILVGLHFAITAFMISQFGWSEFKMIYIFATGWMSIGVWTMFKTGRKHQWKT